MILVFFNSRLKEPERPSLVGNFIFVLDLTPFIPYSSMTLAIYFPNFATACQQNNKRALLQRETSSLLLNTANSLIIVSMGIFDDGNEELY